MTYLLTQMTLYMLCALILGLILGWLIWGRLAERLRQAEADRAQLSSELKARGDGSELKARIDRLNNELDECRRARQANEAEIDRLNGELDVANNRTGMDVATANAVEEAVAITGEGTKPATLTQARGGQADDLAPGQLAGCFLCKRPVLSGLKTAS